MPTTGMSTSVELSRQHPNGKWLLIYDGCTRCCVFDGPTGNVGWPKSRCPTWQRETAFDHFVRTRPKLPNAASFLPHSATAPWRGFEADSSTKHPFHPLLGDVLRPIVDVPVRHHQRQCDVCAVARSTRASDYTILSTAQLLLPFVGRRIMRISSTLIEDDARFDIYGVSGRASGFVIRNGDVRHCQRRRWRSTRYRSPNPDRPAINAATDARQQLGSAQPPGPGRAPLLRPRPLLQPALGHADGGRPRLIL